jgi:hypothetical protein
VALVELLDAIKNEFAPDLEVEDEGGYWRNRDVRELTQKIEFLNHAMDALTNALETDRLSTEAREDPEILATRIERLARKVHETISRPAEHAPVEFPEGDASLPPDPAGHEARWDEMFKNNRRNQERMQRVIEERLLRGEDTETAFEAAIHEVVPSLDWVDDEEISEGRREVLEQIEEFNEACRAASEEAAEPWRAGLAEDAAEDSDWAHEDELEDGDFLGENETGDKLFGKMLRHPLQRRATDLLMKCYGLAERLDKHSQSIDILMRNCMEITGGLAQALTTRIALEDETTDAGLNLVQLKRSLRGAAFVRGALFMLRGEKEIEEGLFKEFMDEIDAISEQIVERLRETRESLRPKN